MTQISVGIGTALTITTGRLLCPIEELHRTLDFITDSALMTHELPAAIEVCGKWLLVEHSELRAIGEPPALLDSEESVRAWLSEVEATFGISQIDVAPLPSEAVEWRVWQWLREKR